MNTEAAEAQGSEVDEPRKEAKSRALESVARTFDTLKHLIAEYDQIREERDAFEHQVAGALDENATLRKQIRDVKGERDHFSHALSALTAQIDSIGSRFIDVANKARAQAYGERSGSQTERKANGGLTEQSADVSIPKFLKQSAEDFQRLASKKRGLSDTKSSSFDKDSLISRLAGLRDDV